MRFIGNFALSSGNKNFENRLRFDEVTAMSLVAPFMWTRRMYIIMLDFIIYFTFDLERP